MNQTLLKVFDYETAFGSFYKLSKTRAQMLHYAARDYFSAHEALLKHHLEVGSLFYFHAPIMHQALEFAIKSVAHLVDEKFVPKIHSHRTSEIIEKYSNTNKAFSLIKNNSEKMDIIQELEKSYLTVRYAEGGAHLNLNKRKVFVEIFEDLLSEYRSLLNDGRLNSDLVA